MKLTCSFFMSSNNFFYFFHIYKNVSRAVNYCQKNKERLQEKIKLVKDIKFFIMKKEKSNNMVANNTKTYQKMKNKSLLRIERSIKK